MTRIGFIGGTGPEGRGLAYRFALAGHEVVIGSRTPERGREAAKEVADRAGSASVTGGENAVAARQAELMVLTVPFAAQADTLPPLREVCQGKIVVSTAVPMQFEGGRPSMPVVPEGSAAEQAQTLLPGALVVGAFQNLGAAKLWKGDEPLDQDVVVCGGDEEAKRQVSALAEQIRGVRAVDGGPLSSARYVEGITVLLVGINKRYKALAGIRIAGL